MVADRRFGPLTIVVLVGLVALSVRLFQIQVRERAVWAREAANLMRSSSVVPYHRGRILDARGRVMVRDEDVYQVELVYRTFRRGHPLGQVAHAWSSLTLHPLPLPDALAELEPLALRLVGLSPAELDDFARGGAIPRLGAHESADPVRDLRSRRASDLRFYVGALLGLDRRDWARIRSLRSETAWQEPLIRLACRADGARDLDAAMEERLAELGQRLRAVRPELERLARHFAEEREPGGLAPLDELVAELEDCRREVEDGTADELFEQATGFGPGRVSTAALATLDLDWIARLLRWDAERLADWVDTRRDAWLASRARLLRRLRHEVWLAAAEHRAERLLDGLAGLFERPDPTRTVRARRVRWRRVDELAVLAELDGLLAGPGAPRPSLALPFQDAGLRDEASGGDGWGLAARVLGPFTGDGAGVDVDPAASAGAWRELAGNGKTWLGEEGDLALERVVDGWEARVVAAADESLAAALGEDGEVLRLAQGRLERARERERYVIKDRSSRPLRLQGNPPYEVVHLLTRYHERYRGFEVRDATRRVALRRNEDGTPVAEELIGSVRQPDLTEVLSQRATERELAALKKKTVRSAEDAERMGELTAALLRADEIRGSTGIEGYFDAELRGRNGFHETDGLQERAEGRGSDLYHPPVDGLDLTLTLDLDLQAAAQRTLAHPEFDRDETRVDRLWLANPVGAIVLMTPDGAVLAAASEPTLPHDPPAARLAERANAMDRVLRLPTFNPPGSVFKPFVAAWALEHHGLDPRASFECAPMPDGGYGYKILHCTHNHADVDLHEALRGSCNAYFARVGDELYDRESFMRMAHAFGFDRPTGVQTFGTEERSGLREESSFKPAVAVMLGNTSNRMRAANGLGVIDATPLQVARATAAIATGRLPVPRLVARIGDELVPPAFEPLDVSAGNLALVRDAMEAVVAASDGTAYGKGLDEGSLGFRIAIKTGSADTWPFKSPSDDPMWPQKKNRMRKHTWIAGWFPAEEPAAVLVVYLHDVAETSSHTAVWIARQLLQSPEVRAWLADPSVSDVARRASREAAAVEASFPVGPVGGSGGERP